MRRLTLLLVLWSSLAFAAARAKKPPPAKPPPPPPPAPAAVAPAPPRPEPKADDALGVVVGVAPGWQYAGGFNRGPMVSTQVSLSPSFLSKRLAIELGLDW